MNKTRTRAARAARTVVSALPSLPLNTKEQIEQAAGAIEAALRDGKTTQAIELNLPLIGATDLDDWPGGIRQQYGALAPMVSEVLRLINAGAEGTCQQRVIDDADAVAALTLRFRRRCLVSDGRGLG